jgi:cytochrome c oxidase subunit 2
MLGLLGEQGSDFAHKVDYAHDVVTIISVVCTVLIVGVMLYFAVIYRQRDGKDHETPHIHGNNALEVIWTTFPTLVCIWVAWLGYDSFVDMRTAPEGAMEINVTARKWAWDFQYKNGKRTTGELVVPVDEPVKLIMRSQDVLHSFFVPVMRTKMDVIPGRYTYEWFRPIKTGDFQVFCTEYCGNDHSRMRARLKVLPKAEFERWLADNSEAMKLASMKPSDRGKEIYAGKCVACHSLDGSPRVGPSWLKLFGKKGELSDGKTYVADENYIRESILNPAAKVVKGYPPQGMPSFQGQLSDEDITGVIEFIKTIDGTTKVEVSAPTPKKSAAAAGATPAERGKALVNDAGNLCSTCHSIDGSKLVGPSFKGIWGRKEKMSDGTEVTVDADYIKESIYKPQAKIVEGYGPVMPAMYEGKLSEQDINDIIEYLKTLS